MRAIEYGLQKYGDYSLKDSETNIFVFNDEIKVEPKEESNQNTIQDNSVFIELENQFTLKKNGDILSLTEFEYIKNTELKSIEKTHSAIQFSYNEIPIIADIYKINNQNFVQIPIDIADPYIYAEEQILFGKNKKTKPAKPTLNTILKDKKMAVVLFVSTDGAQMERAYQSIDTLYENEIVLFIEKNKGVNTFGSVVRVKTGSNITSLGMFPYKDLSKIVKIYNTDIGSDSFEEILKEHLEDKSEKVFLVKDTFLGFFDKVVSFGTDLTLKALQEVAEEFAKEFDQLKIDEKRWKYYKEDGTVTENPDLFLPGLSLVKQAQIKSNEKNELSTSKLNALAIAYIEELEILLKNKVKENQKGNAKESFTKEKAFKKIINLVLEALANAKKFLKNPLGKGLEIAEEIFVTYNAFIVGLLNGLTQAVKGIFDLIALICEGLITLRDLGKEVSKNSITYLSLFFEMLENQLEAFINLFSKENLIAIFDFFKKCLLFSLTMPTRILNWLTRDSKPITLDTIGYYFGYIIGTIIEMVLEILATGGASTVVKAIEKLGKSFADLFKGILTTFSKLAKKGEAFIVDNFIVFINYVKERSKSIKTFLDEIFELLKDLFNISKKSNYLINLDDFVKLRSKFQNENLINLLWKEKITKKFLFPNNLKKLYFKYLNEYPNLKRGFNQAEFKTSIFIKGKKIDEVVEFSISGRKSKIIDNFGNPPNLPSNTINILDDYDNFEKFVKGAKDFGNRGREYDSEIKYIFNFLKTHINKGDEFIIETRNIFKTCGSCQREFVMLEEYLKLQGKKVKIIVYSDETIEGTAELLKNLKLKKK